MVDNQAFSADNGAEDEGYTAGSEDGRLTDSEPEYAATPIYQRSTLPFVSISHATTLGVKEILDVHASRQEWFWQFFKPTLTSCSYYRKCLSKAAEKRVYWEARITVTDVRTLLLNLRYVEPPYAITCEHTQWCYQMAEVQRVIQILPDELPRGQVWMELLAAELEPYKIAWLSFWDAYEAGDAEDSVPMKNALNRLFSITRRFYFICVRLSSIMDRLRPLWCQLEWHDDWDVEKWRKEAEQRV